MKQVPVKSANSTEPYHVIEGGKLLITSSLLAQIVKPKKIPAKGGLDSVVVLRRARGFEVSENCPGVWLAKDRIAQGFALFLSKGNLKVDAEYVIAWVDENSAAAVPVEELESYLQEASALDD